MIQWHGALAFLFLGHFLPSLPQVRGRLTERLGIRGFRALHAIMSTIAIAWLVVAWSGASELPDWFDPHDHAAALAVILMPVAMILVLARVLHPWGEMTRPNAADGIYRIIRYPGSTGLLLWALLHFLATGDGRRASLFLVMMLICLAAMIKNDLVLRRSADQASDRFIARTSLLPFGNGGAAVSALFSKRVLISIVGGLALWVILLILHPLVFGVDPLFWLNV